MAERFTNPGRVTAYELEQLNQTTRRVRWLSAWCSVCHPVHMHSLEEWRAYLEQESNE